MPLQLCQKQIRPQQRGTKALSRWLTKWTVIQGVRRAISIIGVTLAASVCVYVPRKTVSALSMAAAQHPKKKQDRRSTSTRTKDSVCKGEVHLKKTTVETGAPAKKESMDGYASPRIFFALLSTIPIYARLAPKHEPQNYHQRTRSKPIVCRMWRACECRGSGRHRGELNHYGHPHGNDSRPPDLPIFTLSPPTLTPPAHNHAPVAFCLNCASLWSCRWPQRTAPRDALVSCSSPAIASSSAGQHACRGGQNKGGGRGQGPGERSRSTKHVIETSWKATGWRHRLGGGCSKGLATDRAFSHSHDHELLRATSLLCWTYLWVCGEPRPRQAGKTRQKDDDGSAGGEPLVVWVVVRV